MPASLTIQVNGEKRQVPDGATVQSLLESLGMGAGRVACELNLNIVKRADFPSTRLKEGDSVELVQMIGGG